MWVLMQILLICCFSRNNYRINQTKICFISWWPTRPKGYQSKVSKDMVCEDALGVDYFQWCWHPNYKCTYAKYEIQYATMKCPLMMEKLFNSMWFHSTRRSWSNFIPFFCCWAKIDMWLITRALKFFLILWNWKKNQNIGMILSAKRWQITSTTKFWQHWKKPWAMLHMLHWRLMKSQTWTTKIGF
jgi:hypothetical protein